MSASYTYSSSVAFLTTSASLAQTASYIIQAVSASYALNTTSASYALTSTSASYTLNATSASYALNTTSASYALNATTASYARSSSVTVSSSFANNSSTALSSSYALNATTAYNSTNAINSSNVAVTNVPAPNPYYLTFAQTDGYTNLFINSASVAGIGTLSYDITTNTIGANLSGSVNGTITSASYAQTASYSNTLGALLTNPGVGSLRLYASDGTTILTSISNLSASYASTASYALTATSASYTLTATSASYARSSSVAVSSSYASTSTTSLSASYASTSTTASYALTATTSLSSSYALSSSIAVSASYALNSSTAANATSVNFTGIKSLPAALSGSGGFGGVSDVASLTSNQASNSLINGMFYNASSAGGAITITLDAATYFGFEFTVFASNLANDISFMAGAGQTIISADSNLKINKAGSSAVAKYITTDTWALIGDLKA